jgi:anti-sigma B factor antagonist
MAARSLDPGLRPRRRPNADAIPFGPLEANFSRQGSALKEAVVEIQHSIDASTEATRIRPSGDIDMAVADRLQQVLTSHLANGAVRVVVDLEDVSFLDSSGIRALVIAHRFAKEHQRSLTVENPPPMVRTVLEIGGVMNMLTAELDKASAQLTETPSDVRGA